MRKLRDPRNILEFTLVFCLVLCAGIVIATDYYGGAAGKNHNANDLWFTGGAISGSCTGVGDPVSSATVLQAGNNLYANGCTIAIVDSFTAGKISTEDGDAGGNAVAGGGYTVAINSVGALTFTTNIRGGTSDCLAISGAGAAGTELTIVGDITGGDASGIEGVIDTHTGAGAIIAVTGNITGGSSTSAYGYNMTGATGTVNITGNATASNTSHALRNYSTGAIMTLTGDCIGAAGGDYYGCVAPLAGPFTVTGKIIAGARGSGAAGSIRWAPSSAQKYIKFDGGGTAIYAGAGLGSDAGGTQIDAGANTAAKVLSSAYFINKSDAAYSVGTATSGGGTFAAGY